MEALKAALHQEEFPNSHRPPGFGEPLIYAIYHSPIAFIRQLLEIGADPKTPADDGFPPLIAALTSDRSDRNDIVKLLLEFLVPTSSSEDLMAGFRFIAQRTTTIQKQSNCCCSTAPI
jgi:ankyrin repeat protein